MTSPILPGTPLSRFKQSQGATVHNRKKFLSNAVNEKLKLQKNVLKKAKKIANVEIKKMLAKIKIVEDKLKKKQNDDEYCKRWGKIHYALSQKLLKLRLEKQFPKIMRWMLRIVVPEDEKTDLLFIGIRDFNVETLDGKYSSEGAAREWSTVVDIYIPPSSIKPVSLFLSRISSILKTPKTSLFLTI